MIAHSINEIEKKATVRPAYGLIDYDVNEVMNDAKAMRARYIYAWTRQAWQSLAAKWRQRRAYRRAFTELQGFSDYELHDIGLSRSDLRSAVYGKSLPWGERLATALSNAMARLFGAIADWRRHRQTVVELNSLDDHVLRDIGVNRGDITNVVYGHAGARDVVANANQPRTAA